MKHFSVFPVQSVLIYYLHIFSYTLKITCHWSRVFKILNVIEGAGLEKHTMNLKCMVLVVP